MNKLDRIKNLENELAELKSEIIKDNEVVDWNPSTGSYLIDFDGNVIGGDDDGCESIEGAKNFGVEFDDENQAKQAAIAYRRYHRLYRLALELNGDDYLPEWNDGKYKHYIEIDNGVYRTNSRSYTKNISGIYFKSEKLAQKAINMIGDELV